MVISCLCAGGTGTYLGERCGSCRAGLVTTMHLHDNQLFVFSPAYTDLAKLSCNGVVYFHTHVVIRARIFKLLSGSGIDSKELVPPAYVAWRAGTITLPIPTRFLGTIDCFKIPAQLFVIRPTKALILTLLVFIPPRGNQLSVCV